MKQLTIFLFAAIFSSACWSEIAVIATANSSFTVADSSELERIYLGKSSKLGETNVTPINQNGNSETATNFNQVVLNKSSSQVKAYWSKLVFTGKGTPPKELDGDAAVIAAVSADANAIGYINAAAVTTDVKVLTKF